MKIRKTIALLALAATVTACASPQVVSRTAGLDLVKATAVTGTYR